MHLMFAALMLAGISQATMPVDQVRPGMWGYGLSVFQGTKPERFDFTVTGVTTNYAGLPFIILVSLEGGPQNVRGVKLLTTTGTIAGMSGSPMYVDGRLVGALAYAPEHQIGAQAFIIPIEYMREARSRVAAKDGASDLACEPGDYILVCRLWGPGLDDCAGVTVTLRDGGTLLTTGHDLDTVPIGQTQLAVFSSEVTAIIRKTDRSVKLPGALGRPLGTLVLNAKAGSVVRLGPLPRLVPVRLQMAGLIGGSVRQYHAVQTVPMADVVRSAMMRAIYETNGQPELLEIRVTVKLVNVPGAITFVDGTVNALKSLGGLISVAVQQGVAIERIDLKVTRPSHLDTFEPVTIEAKFAELRALTLGLTLLRNRDHRVFTKDVVVDTVMFVQPKGSELVWFDGANIQEMILGRGSLRDSLELLAKIADRQSLYLVTVRNSAVPIAGELLADAWAQTGTTIDVLYRLDRGNLRMVISDAKPFPARIRGMP